MFNRHHQTFQELWQTYLTTGSAADLARRTEQRVITAHLDIHIKLSYIRRHLVIAWKKSQIILGFMDVTFPLSRLTYKNRGTLLMQTIARLQQGLVFRCSKTTTSEFLIGLRVVLNEHVWAELDQTIDADHSVIMFLMEAGGMYCWNLPKIPPEVCNVNEKQM